VSTLLRRVFFYRLSSGDGDIRGTLADCPCPLLVYIAAAVIRHRAHNTDGMPLIRPLTIPCAGVA
jgi:hypothetical protein